MFTYSFWYYPVVGSLYTGPQQYYIGRWKLFVVLLAGRLQLYVALLSE